MTASPPNTTPASPTPREPTAPDATSPASRRQAGAQRAECERSQTTGRQGERRVTSSWTVLELLRWTTDYFAGKGIDSPRLDAEVLLAHALDSERLRLYLDYEKPILDEERARFRELVRTRAEDRVPVALLTGTREFWSLPLEVSGDVLVPRPETETLVETVLAHFPDADAPLRLLDVGTGSGAVALALAKERSKAEVVGVDRSAAALAVAARNGEALGIRVDWREGDLFAPVTGERFDAVVSNPPYVALADEPTLPPELAHEPREALFAGEDGTEVLRRLADAVNVHLEPGGVFAVELDPRQAPLMADWLTQRGFVEVATHRDLEERPRVVAGRVPPEEE